MTAIASTALMLSANSTKLIGGLNDASKKIADFNSNVSKGINSTFGGITSLAAKFAAPIAAAVTMGKAISDMGAIADSGDMAASLGVDTKFFTGTLGAFKQVGGGAEDLQKSLLELGKTTKFDNSNITKAFADIGVSAEQFAGMGIEDKFRSVQMAMDKMGPGADKFAVAMLGKSGAKLAPIMAQGSAEMQKLAGQFQLTADEVSKIQDGEGAWQNLLNTATGVWQKILVSIAPVLEVVSNGLTVALDSVVPVIQVLGEYWSTTFSIMYDAIGLIWTPIEETVSWLAELAAQTLGFGDTAATVSDYTTEGWKFVAKGAAYVYDSIKLLGGGIGYVAGAFFKGVGYIIQGIKNLIDMAKMIPGVSAEWIDGITGTVQKAEDSMKGIGQGMQDMAADTWNTFGDSAKKVDSWFEKRKEMELKVREQEPVEKKSQVSNKGPNFLAPDVKDAVKNIGYTAVAAMTKGSKEAYSLEAKFKTGAMVGGSVDINAKQYEETKKISHGIQDLKQTIERKDLKIAVV